MAPIVLRMDSAELHQSASPPCFIHIQTLNITPRICVHSLPTVASSGFPEALLLANSGSICPGTPAQRCAGNGGTVEIFRFAGLMFKYFERPMASSRMTVTREVSEFTPCVVPSLPLCRDPAIDVSPCTSTLVLGALTLIVQTFPTALPVRVRRQNYLSMYLQTFVLH